jgi:hypothetical protein
MSSSKQQPPPTPTVLDQVQDLLIRARAENRAANDEIPPAVQLATLSQDSGYLKLAVYSIGILLLILAGAAWTGFLHLDDKIEHKIDYINSRIDHSILQKNRPEITNPTHPLQAASPHHAVQQPPQTPNSPQP